MEFKTILAGLGEKQTIRFESPYVCRISVCSKIGIVYVVFQSTAIGLYFVLETLFEVGVYFIELICVSGIVFH